MTFKEFVKLKSIDEMALQSYNMIGFDKNDKTGTIKGHSFSDKRDRNLIVHPTNIKQVKNFYKNSEVDFDFYFVNKKGARNFMERGEVSLDFLTAEDKLGLDKKDIANINNDNITVFFVGNSAAEKQPMTAWNTAHRFGHAIGKTYAFMELIKFLEGDIDRLLKCYGIKTADQDKNAKTKSVVFNQLGTMRSARLGKINRYFEFYYELFAQYLNNGKIILNKLPPRIKIGTGPYGRVETAKTADVEEVEHIISSIENTFGYYAADALSECVGKIFVM